MAAAAPVRLNLRNSSVPLRGVGRRSAKVKISFCRNVLLHGLTETNTQCVKSLELILTWSDALQWGSTAIAALGGYAVLIGGPSAFMGKLFADRSITAQKAEFDGRLEKLKNELGRETERLKGELARDAETHKLKLKKQELLFSKMTDATTAFIELRQGFEPSYQHPDYGWEEAMDWMIEKFTDFESRVRVFYSKHGVVMSAENRSRLRRCMENASSHQFAEYEGGQAVKAARDAASSLRAELQELEDRLVAEIRD